MKKISRNGRKKRRDVELERQRALEAERIEKEILGRHKGGWSHGKVFGVVCLIALLLISYGAWQYGFFKVTISMQPSTEIPLQEQNPSTEPPSLEQPQSPEQPPMMLAPDFTLTDINGTRFFLHDYNGKVIVVHFMVIGCQGLREINENQLTQLKSICNEFCKSGDIEIITVALASCQTYDLEVIRQSYGVTWFLGNDLDDGDVDIVRAYAKYANPFEDGMVVLIDKTFQVEGAYGAITDSILSSTINGLLRS